VSRNVLSPAARVDLERIWDYTVDRWGAERAEEYVREIQRASNGAALPSLRELPK
jgi:toxin ParE1/3/4